MMVVSFQTSAGVHWGWSLVCWCHALPSTPLSLLFFLLLFSIPLPLLFPFFFFIVFMAAWMLLCLGLRRSCCAFIFIYFLSFVVVLSSFIRNLALFLQLLLLRSRFMPSLSWYDGLSLLFLLFILLLPFILCQTEYFLTYILLPS